MAETEDFAAWVGRQMKRSSTEWDWAATALGEPNGWPSTLRVAARLILSSRFPMFIAWGPELSFLYNEAYTQFLGAKHPAAFGMPFESVWSEIWPDIVPLVQRALAGEASYLEDLPLVILRDGRQEQTWFTFSYSPIYDDQGEIAGMYCAVTETSSRVRVERRQAFQLRVAQALHQLTQPDEVMATASRLLGEHFGVGRVGYGEIDRSGKTVTVHADWTDGAMSSLAGESRQLDSFGPGIIRELTEGKTLRLDDMALDLRSSAYATAYASIGVASMLAVPLREGPRLTAILYLHEPRVRQWTDEEITLAEDVAQRTWEAVKRARAEEALRDETRILELLEQTGRIVASTLDMQTLLQSITDTATQLSGAQFGSFFYNNTNEQGDVFTLYTLSGAPREAFDRFGHPRATPLFGPTFNGEPPIRSDDVTKDPRYGRWGPSHGMPPNHLPVRSYLAVPVVSRTGRAIGGLFFGHSATGIFTERTERIVVGVAAQAAVAIDNALLYEDAQKAAEEREQLLNRERSARSEAERLSRMKDEFLAMLAHELRNPLAPISNAAELLSMLYPGEPRVSQSSAVIRRQVAHLTRLVDDLLDVSRVTRNLVTLDRKTIDFRSVISEAIGQVRPLLEKRRHHLALEMPDQAVHVPGDETRLVQTIANLLNNAAKFTPEGGRIDLTLRTTQDALRLHVKDNGAGISPELLPAVFELFTQGTRTLERSQGGLGLGLALVKKLVELHGGRVSAYSSGPGQGSEFIVELPLESSNEAKPDGRSGPAIPPPTGQAHRAGLYIAVVDDNPDSADTLATLLRAQGHEVAVHYSPHDALRAAATRAPQAYLLDIGLPDIDGYELARRLRALPQAAQSRLIAITGYGQLQDRERSAAAGFSTHLVKPVDIAALSSALGDVASSSARLPFRGGR
jgi:signal transduction histidine kinase/ActR/RegA family two-component response regulator